MRKISAIIFCVIFLVSCLAACENSNSPIVNNIDLSEKQKQEQPKDKEAIWPYLDGSMESGAIMGPDHLFDKNFVLTLDGSGSMNEKRCASSPTPEQKARGEYPTKCSDAKRAVIEWINSPAAQGANIGLFSFSEIGYTEYRIPAERQKLIQAVNKMECGGGTPLSIAFERAYNQLTVQAKRQRGYGYYTIVSVTDGEANAGYSPDQWVDFILKKTPIDIYTVGFCIDENHSLNQRGKTFYRTAQNLEELRRGLEDILAESSVEN